MSVREYREIVAGDRMPSLDVYRRSSELVRVAASLALIAEEGNDRTRECRIKV